MDNCQPVFEATIYGEPASKANSRRLVGRKGSRMLIKSAKALDYSATFAAQCPVMDSPFECDVVAEIEIWYASRRPDLDESLILDLLQGRAYRNDRQVKKKVITWGLDRNNPRAFIRVLPLS